MYVYVCNSETRLTLGDLRREEDLEKRAFTSISIEASDEGSISISTR